MTLFAEEAALGPGQVLTFVTYRFEILFFCFNWVKFLRLRGIFSLPIPAFSSSFYHHVRTECVGSPWTWFEPRTLKRALSRHQDTAGKGLSCLLTGATAGNTFIRVRSVQNKVSGSLFSLVHCFVSCHWFYADFNKHLYCFVEKNDASVDLVK